MADDDEDRSGLTRPWRWTYEGDSWTLQDYTLAELDEIEQKCGLAGYVELMPRANAKHAMVAMAVHLRRRLSAREVEGIVKNLTLADIEKIVSLDPERDADADLPSQWVDGIPKGDRGSV